MANDMNAIELNDEQLAEVAGANGSLISNVGNPQISVNNNFQLNIGVAPTIGVVVGGGKLEQLGSQFDFSNKGVLGALNNHQ